MRPARLRHQVSLAHRDTGIPVVTGWKLAAPTAALRGKLSGPTLPWSPFFGFLAIAVGMTVTIVWSLLSAAEVVPVR